MTFSSTGCCCFSACRRKMGVDPKGKNKKAGGKQDVIFKTERKQNGGRKNVWYEKDREAHSGAEKIKEHNSDGACRYDGNQLSGGIKLGTRREYARYFKARRAFGDIRSVNWRYSLQQTRGGNCWRNIGWGKAFRYNARRAYGNSPSYGAEAGRGEY